MASSSSISTILTCTPLPVIDSQLVLFSPSTLVYLILAPTRSTTKDRTSSTKLLLKEHILRSSLCSGTIRAWMSKISLSEFSSPRQSRLPKVSMKVKMLQLEAHPLMLLLIQLLHIQLLTSPRHCSCQIALLFSSRVGPIQ